MIYILLLADSQEKLLLLSDGGDLSRPLCQFLPTALSLSLFFSVRMLLSCVSVCVSACTCDVFVCICGKVMENSSQSTALRLQEYSKSVTVKTNSYAPLYSAIVSQLTAFCGMYRSVLPLCLTAFCGRYRSVLPLCLGSPFCPTTVSGLTALSYHCVWALCILQSL